MAANHDDHGDTKQCPVCWETAQLGSHVDWWMEDSITGQQQLVVGHHNASCDYYHDDHEDTKQCLRGWETTQLGSHADWWMEDSITGQQQPSGIKVHHCNDWW
eukprot:CAMPEP_0194700634 /NCGR_PEP_ID=MMETSP0295-20121207/25679_1 /TAXON_ID=39354 /ORGANISM="Heterosigma akashiwo, Strain CCMP2393" /LENGTH=102 /DNA_ID=CAMNT_0039594615 /DNA_START=8 /DNA_END=313 /DNA_ORIENTATION=-